MLVDQDRDRISASKSNGYETLSSYEQPSFRKAFFQMVDTYIPYLALWAAMVRLVHQGYPYWIILSLAFVAAAFLGRIFIFFHDSSHGSFFALRRANRIHGYISGILIFTPYEDWQYAHAWHHVTNGDLDRRGVGDVWMLTVEEYLALPGQKRLAYRLFRNPFVLFGLIPTVLFFVVHRFPHKRARSTERYSTIFTNLAILVIMGAASLTIGLRTYFLIQLPIMIFAGTGAVWVFYIQHQFEGTYWARHKAWDSMRAALEGSSYYKLSRVLQWVSGNIGLHHVHHIRPRIPNYNLQQCYDDIPALQGVEPLTIRSSLKSLRANLWDEATGKMVSFRSLKDTLPACTGTDEGAKKGVRRTAAPAQPDPYGPGGGKDQNCS